MRSSGVRSARNCTRTCVAHLTVAAAIVIATFGSGRSRVELSAASSPSAPGFTMGGVVRDAGTMRIVPGARILVTSGANAGTSVIADVGGAFTLQNLPAGSIDLQGTKDGYLAAHVQAIDVSQPKATVDIRLYPAPPRDVHGAAAIARCNDESWSWAETTARACTNNGGVATIYLRAYATWR